MFRLVGLNNVDYNNKIARVKSILDVTRARHLVTLEGEDVPPTLTRDIHIKPENILHACGSCHASGTAEQQIDLKCALCRVARYCNRDCQTNHWKDHKAHCYAFGVNRYRVKKPILDAIIRNDLIEVQ